MPDAATILPSAAVFPPPGVRHVVFDVVGTLVEPSPPVPAAYALAAARRGIEVSPDEVRPRFSAAWRRQEEIDSAAVAPFVTSRSRELERWRSIVHDVFADRAGAAVREALFDDLWDHFARPDAWRPLEPGARLVRRALDAGCGVALASNFDERLVPLAAVLEPLTLATDVFASSEIGWRKPAREFFRVIEDRLGRKPHELALVGDDARLDVAAARAAGWHGLSPDDPCCGRVPGGLV